MCCDDTLERSDIDELVIAPIERLAAQFHN
jgi:hypothetical protein